MFLIRAAFWIVIVSMLLPREPDLGVGRPESGIALLDRFHAAAMQSLEMLKAELAARHSGDTHSPI